MRFFENNFMGFFNGKPWQCISAGKAYLFHYSILTLFLTCSCLLSRFGLTVGIELGKLSGVNYLWGNRLRTNFLGVSYTGGNNLGKFLGGNYLGRAII